MEELQPEIPTIALGEKFATFEDLRDAIERYQFENQVQLIVKDSKLLGCIAKKIPKFVEAVNKDIIYYRLTYACEFHGEFKSRGKMRPKHQTKRRGCPMRIGIRLAEDLHHLVVHELYEDHNHPLEPKQVPKTPRQQIFRLSRTAARDFLLEKMERGDNGQLIGTEAASGSQNFDVDFNTTDVNSLPASSSSPVARIIGNGVKRVITAADANAPFSFVDMKKRRLTLQNRKLELETQKLELENKKLELELKALKRREEESGAQPGGGDTYYVSHVIDDSKERVTESMANYTTNSATAAEVIKTLAGRGQPFQIITQ